MIATIRLMRSMYITQAIAQSMATITQRKCVGADAFPFGPAEPRPERSASVDIALELPGVCLWPGSRKVADIVGDGAAHRKATAGGPLTRPAGGA